MNICLQLINKCQLQCKFCGKQFLSKDEKKVFDNSYMSYEIFKQIIDKYIEFSNSVIEINLTPVIGEAFLHDDILKILDYLEQSIKIKNYFIVTNFINIDKDILLHLSKLKKFDLLISVYGFDEKTFIDITKKKLFNKFINNMKLLADIKNLNVELLIRSKTQKTNVFLHIIRYSRQLVNTNLAGLIPLSSNDNEIKMPKKKGICLNALYNSITPDGNISICDNADYRYIGKQVIIGNVFEQPLEDIYKEDSIFGKIIKNQYNRHYTKYCTRCNEYEDISYNELKNISKNIKWIKKLC